MNTTLAPAAEPSAATGERVYTYQAPWPMLVLAIAFFGGGGYFMFHQALTNDRGLIIDGIIQLSSDNATIFYLFLAFVCFGFVLAAIAAGITRVANPHFLLLTADGVSVPKFVWSLRPTFIRFTDIRTLTPIVVKGKHFLRITHAAGRLNVNPSLMESEGLYQQACREIAERVMASRK